MLNFMQNYALSAATKDFNRTFRRILSKALCPPFGVEGFEIWIDFYAALIRNLYL
jgi:hypothetical protein